MRTASSSATTKLGGVVGIGALRRGIVGPRIIEIPILVQLHVLLGRDQVVAGRNLKNPVKERAHLMSAEFDGVIDGLGIPTSRHSGGKQGFHFRCEIERFPVEGVEQRLDAEAVAGGEDRPVGFIPKHKSEFAAQSVQALRAEIFIEMQSDLAVGSGAQAVTRLFEFALDRFIAVEFAVDDDPGLFVLAGDRLISGCEIDDAEPRVAEGNAAVGRNPVALPIGAAMIEALGGPLHAAAEIGSRREKRATIPHMLMPSLLSIFPARFRRVRLPEKSLVSQDVLFPYSFLGCLPARTE